MPVITLATATSGVAHRSVIHRLRLIRPHAFVSSFSQPGVDLAIGQNFRTGRGGGTVLRFVGQRDKRDKVVCYVDQDGARAITRVLRGRKVQYKICRTKLSTRGQSRARSSFVGSHVRIMYTAVTFNVKVSGSGIH